MWFFISQNEKGNKETFHSWNLLPPVATPSKHHCNPDEDVDGVHVDADGGVDGVEGRSAIVGRVGFGLVDNFLGVVQQEGAKLERRTSRWAKLLKQML